MKRINDKGFSEILRMVIIISFVAAIYMTGIYVWQYIETEKRVNNVISQLNKILAEAQEERKDSIDFSSGTQGGCANIFLYNFNKERTNSLSVDVDVKNLGLINEKKVYFDLPQDGISVKLYRGDFLGFLHCTNKLPKDLLDYEELEVKSGKIAIFLKDYNFVDQYIEDYDYSASVALRDLVFVDNNKEIYIGKYTFNSVGVGWVPGNN